MSLLHRIESLRFWDLATMWAKERLEHEDLVARALATAVVRDGLMLYSTDPRWLRGDDGRFELRGTPFVGYSPSPIGETMILRLEALEHLLRVVRRAALPSREVLDQEFVYRADFARWLVGFEERWPAFWFADGPEVVDA